MHLIMRKTKYVNKKRPLQVMDSEDIVFQALEGVDAEVFNQVVDEYNISDDQLAGLLNISKRTISNYIQKKRTLSPFEGELLLKYRRLNIKGKEIFGSLEAFHQWLNKPAFGLDNRIPFSLLRTSEGINLVMDEVERIAFGEFA